MPLIQTMPSSQTATKKTALANFRELHFFFSAVVLPISVGVAIYVVFRDDNILLLQLLRFLGIKQTFRLESPDSLTVILGSLPDGLWVFSYSIWLRLIWNRITVWMLIPIALAVASEIGQLLTIVPGTFDVYDLFAYSLAFLCSLLIRTNDET